MLPSFVFTMLCGWLVLLGLRLVLAGAGAPTGILAMPFVHARPPFLEMRRSIGSVTKSATLLSLAAAKLGLLVAALATLAAGTPWNWRN